MEIGFVVVAIATSVISKLATYFSIQMYEAGLCGYQRKGARKDFTELQSNTNRRHITENKGK